MIRVRDLRLSYRTTRSEHPAIRGVSLDIAEGQFYTLLGPSGCGKTTTLRCVAGLERPDSGEIIIGNVVVFSKRDNIWVPPHSRKIGMVFQSYAIWPHMTVFDNVAFPLRHKTPRPSQGEIRDRVRKVLTLVRLNDFETRWAPYLSGGQQQRLALARALVAEPRVLLLDEPLSNLDAKLREDMRLEIRELIERLRITALYVTHEQIEALSMSNIVGVMREGIIVQEGTPNEIYRRPVHSFVADFIGKTNMVAGRVLSVNGTTERPRAMIDTAIGRIACLVNFDAPVGSAITLVVRPEDISLTQEPTSGENVLEGRVEALVYLGNLLECAVKVGDRCLRVQVHPSAVLKHGAVVHLRIPAEHCLALKD